MIKLINDLSSKISYNSSFFRNSHANNYKNDKFTSFKSEKRMKTSVNIIFISNFVTNLEIIYDNNSTTKTIINYEQKTVSFTPRGWFGYFNRL